MTTGYRPEGTLRFVKWSWVLTLALSVFGAACGDSIEDRAASVYQECAAEYGLEGGVVGIVRGPDGRFAITAPDLPEPAATECRRRVNAVLRDD